MTMKSPWIMIRADEPFSCPYFAVRQDLVTHAGGTPLIYSSVRTKFHGVGVIPVDADGQVTLVGQYRYVTNQYSWEVPGGGGRHDRPPLESAREELSEETGISAASWLQILDVSVAPGTSDSLCRGFVAWNLEHGTPHPEPEESLALRRLQFHDAVSMAVSGELNNLATIAMLLALHVRSLHGNLPDDLLQLLAKR
jgi:8-oxo-dGTP pyrophosphatase MutT (NUDIX family)